jgi:hypothetical protein
VFSALPLLRYLRGHTIFDYELWYAPGTRVLAGDEIFFFRAAKYEFMYPPPCALFLAGASLLGQGGLILLLVMISSAAWFCSAKLSAKLAVGQRYCCLSGCRLSFCIFSNKQHTRDQLASCLAKWQ